jgi:cytochrome P450
MTIPLLHLNPTIFPSPTTFNPSRWLNNPQLDRYLFSFSKGPRACIGMNLAWAELYNAVAAVFGHYGSGEGGGEGPCMKLWQTTEKDVLLEHDYFVPFPWAGSQGVRVVVNA